MCAIILFENKSLLTISIKIIYKDIKLFEMVQSSSIQNHLIFFIYVCDWPKKLYKFAEGLD